MKRQPGQGYIENNQILYDCDARFQWEGVGESVSVLMFDTRYSRAIGREYQGIWLWGRSDFDFDHYDHKYLAGHMGW
jgi:hypothetical protein